MKKISKLAGLLATVFVLSTAYENETTRVMGANNLPQELINLDTRWSYYDEEDDPVKSGKRTGWTEASYGVRKWKKTPSGKQAKFGAKNGELKEVDSYMPEILLKQYKAGTKVNTEAFFFRTDVMLDTVPQNTALVGKILYDDAALVYVNGKLIAEFDNYQRDNSSKKFDKNMQYGGRNSSVAEGYFILEADILKEGQNVIAVEIHQGQSTSSDVYFEMTSLVLDELQVEQKAVSLNVGEDETSRNISWYSNTKNGKVQYAPKNGTKFPKKYVEVKTTVGTTNNEFYYNHRAEMNNLLPNTEYVYRLINNDKISDTYEFQTTGTGDFEFWAVGDPQIGASSIDKDGEGWEKALNMAYKKNADAAFILSAGDQVNNADNEFQYDEYLEHDVLKTIPTANMVGNHDSSNQAYSQHFHHPNVTAYGKSKAGSNYWFTYNNTLFLCMNSNNESIAEHRAFIEQAVKENPNVNWKIVSFHHSIYSAAGHASQDDILKRREKYVPIFNEFDIDVVLMGHDHVYVRSYMMEGFEPVVTQTVENRVKKPEGILYMTLNSSSGSKFYGMNERYAYAAVQSQERIPNISHIEITEDVFKITTYRVDEEMSVLDEFTIDNQNPIKKKSVKNLNVKLTGYDAVNIDWSKVAGATGYKVYYKKNSASSYKLFKTVKNNSCKIQNLADGVKYIFKVVPYAKEDNKTINGIQKTTSLYTLKKLNKPKLSKSGSKVKVKWNNISGETGYQISKSSKKNGTNIVATIKTTNGTSKIVKADRNKTYYYKVRVYKEYNGKRVYSPWSNVVMYKRK